MKKIFFVCTIFFSLNYLFADNLGWDILRKNYSIKDISISNPQDTQNILVHPSAIRFVEKNILFFPAEINTLGTYLTGAHFFYNMKSLGIFSGIIYNDIGKETFSYIENNQEKQKEIYLQKDFVYNIGIAKFLKKGKISAALNLKIANTTIQDKSSNAFVIDFDLVYKDLIKNLNLSILTQNIGYASKFLNESDKLPIMVGVGSNYSFSFKKLNSNLVVGVFLPYIINYELQPSLGVEFTKNPIRINLSYNFTKDDNNLQIGVSTVIKNIELGYSLIPNKYLGTTHRILLGYSF